MNLDPLNGKLEHLVNRTPNGQLKWLLVSKLESPGSYVNKTMLLILLPEDVAFFVARFIQNGGSFMNYYMYHGGTNFGTTLGRFVATSYDYDAPIDEYELIREPKYTHLKNLHKAIKMSEPALISSNPTVTKLGSNQEVHVFSANSGACAAFLANYDTSSSAKVTFGGSQYDLPPWSVSILPDCKKELYIPLS